MITLLTVTERKRTDFIVKNSLVEAKQALFERTRNTRFYVEGNEQSVRDDQAYPTKKTPLRIWRFASSEIHIELEYTMESADSPNKAAEFLDMIGASELANHERVRAAKQKQYPCYFCLGNVSVEWNQEILDKIEAFKNAQ